jgi:hypothetical protein
MPSGQAHKIRAGYFAGLQFFFVISMMEEGAELAEQVVDPALFAAYGRPA